MILQAQDVERAARHAWHHSQSWMSVAVKALVDTWNSAPLEKRWTVGVIVLLFMAAGKWLLPGIAQVIAATHGVVKDAASGVFKKKGD
jgi:hypothetical protein